MGDRWKRLRERKKRRAEALTKRKAQGDQPPDHQSWVGDDKVIR